MYDLQELVKFDDLPTPKPRYTEIHDVTWVSGKGGKAGKLSFPPDFDGILEAEFATNELLNYYGCSIANTRRDDTIIVDMRHAIQVPK